MSAIALHELQFKFVSEILPKIEKHGCIYFRHKRPDLREDLVAEMVALSWKWFLRLHARGKDACGFPSILAGFAARAVNSGRRVCGMEPGKDCLSCLAQKRHDFAVQKLPDYDTVETGNDALEPLRDNTVTPPPDQAHFRDAYPRWLGLMPDRNRRIAEDMAVGESTQGLAAKYKVSAARVSQLRRELHDSWVVFTE